MANKRLMDILRNYIANDLEMVDPEYVRSVLSDICLCTAEEIFEIGLDWLYPDGVDGLPCSRGVKEVGYGVLC